ncbi:MAG: chemotaxis protein CheX [Phycisphaerae bacterium]|nr:chemotaxis protein CheX [Phycisphaerae bacterium]
MSTCGTVAEPCEDLGEDLFQDGVVISVISVMGGVEWSIFLGLPRATAIAVAEGFAGFAIPFDSEDMGDAVGEMTNILAGGVKQILDKRGVNVEISLPSVFRAEGLHILKQRNSHSTRTCYSCSLGPLWTGVIAGCDAGVVA